MSGPAGSGKSGPAAGLAGVIRSVARKQADNEEASPVPDDVGPSKQIPATGLKKKTDEWQKQVKEGEDARGRSRSRRSSQSSNTSIPSQTATKSSDGVKTTAQTTPEEEVPKAHFETPLKPREDRSEDDRSGGRDDGESKEAQANGSTGLGGMISQFLGFGSPSKGDTPQATKSDGKQDEEEDDHLSPPHDGDHVHAEPPPTDHTTSFSGKTDQAIGVDRPFDAKEKEDRGRKEIEHDEECKRAKQDKEDDQERAKIDEEEKIIPRDDEDHQRNDELGRFPEGIAAVKWEEPPQAFDKVNLKTRIPHQHYHHRKDVSPTGEETKSILKITPDGEGEYPPGQTPPSSAGPSRRNSLTDARGAHPGEDGQGQAQGAGKGKQREERGVVERVANGHWTTALEPQPATSNPIRRPKRTSRFSSMRESRPFSSEHHPSPSHHPPPPTPHARVSSSEDDDRSSPPSPQQQAQRRWSLLRAKVIPSKAEGTGPIPGPNMVSALSNTAVASVPVTTELFAGQLPVMMLKTWIDRDEQGVRAVPVLLGNLRFRVGDSVGLRVGRETGKEMFKVECEYGDGAVKWVIYRELRDFLKLHANYKAANFGSSIGGLRSSRHIEIPEFPKMSIPYLNKLQGREMGKEKSSKSEYAQASRDALQHYLVELIRAVIFRPESNRLCKFFELSALTVSLAPSGGFQGKAGFLKIPGSNASRRANQPGLTPQSWLHNRSPKWFIVRDSYFVATRGPEDTDFYDVFLLDQDFTIERPKRAYRHGLQIVTGQSTLHALKHGSGHDDDEPDIDLDNPLAREMAIAAGEGQGDDGDNLKDDYGEGQASQHTFFIVNSQRRLKLMAKNARYMHQFIVSMERISAQCIWTSRNRFDSFAPLRVNVAAQWLVDGRDYFWNLSRAINMAKDRIYIHDWWVSPELYLRRPGDERYRLDNLLERKAKEGVKIFLIIYNEVSDKTTPVDSLYAKKKLTGLHPNIMLQRSPSHFQTGTFYWSHHEKLCVIDETIAFMGGLDLCYGRWDTSQHVLTDEDFSSSDGPDGPIWRGKDYSNERVMEYSNLDKPFDDMFDRSKVPRMPWHDVGLQMVGQPARDLCRHFVQRWNLLIRTKNHKRQMPFLLPPPDFTDRELSELKLQGTCEVQICRSVGPWSMGTLTKIEHSVQNAYCKSIEMSEHFVYIENQFFITSTVVDGIGISNGVGDALVDRIIRAHKERTPWRACIMIPLLPGYTYPIDSNEASSVRLILECQNRTIARGANSIFSRLRKEGIDPDDHITFFSLRAWSKFKSGVLTTEQVYIHGKTMIVDDRIVLCGSANINERSQRGDRDSELIAVIRDTDMIESTMAGKPFKVGRFAHSLRVRLMREHAGVDVDSIEEDQLMSREPVADADEIETWDPDHEQQGKDDYKGGITTVKKRYASDRLRRTVEMAATSVTKGLSENALDNVHRAANVVIHPASMLKNNEFITPGGIPGEKEEREDYNRRGKSTEGFASSIVPTLEEKTLFERRPDATHANGKPLFDLIEEGENAESDGEAVQTSAPGEAQVPDKAKQGESIIEENKDASRSEKKAAPKIKKAPDEKELYGIPANAVDDDDAPPTKDSGDREPDEDEKKAISARKTLRKHLAAKTSMSAWTMPTPTPKVNPNRFVDPLDDTFWKDMWVAVAVHNTEIFRKVFRSIPDDLVTTWAAYKAFANHAEKHNKAPEDVAAPQHDEPVKVTHEGPGTHGAGGGGSGGGAVGQGTDEARGKSDTKDSDLPRKQETEAAEKAAAKGLEPPQSPIAKSVSSGASGLGHGGDGSEKTSGGDRTPSGANEPWAQWERDEMEMLLNEVRGHLVVYPQRFLELEDQIGNFLFQSDKILPLPIYD